MDVIHAQEVAIARERVRAIRGFSSMWMSMRGNGTGSTTTTGLDAEAMMLNQYGFGFVEEIERLNVRKNRLANLRASITHEDLRSALRATERAILTQLKLELSTSHQEEETDNTTVKAAAPEIEGLKRVSITKQSSSSSSNNNKEEEGDQIDDVCSICHEELKIGDDVRSVMGCSHVYHYNCIAKWIKRKPTCPMCRYEIPTNVNTNNKRRRR